MRTAQRIEDEEQLIDDQADFHLGMGSLIGIFFGLAVVCGVFFGFGYMMGHRGPGPLVPSEPLYVAPASSAAPTPKPSAQVAAQQEDASRVVVPAAPPLSESVATAEDNTQPAVAGAPVEKSRPAAKPAAATPVPSPAVSIAAPPTGTIMVQIAAVKSRTDAEALAAALQKNGFHPAIHNEPQDKLLHVQVGPFSTREEAKSMRQKLAGAGYNAFIK